ncbi:MAG: PAS domain-containing protein [Dissulfurispiraceae bacterium]
MKKIKEKTPKLNTAAKKSSSKTSKSKSQESHVEANTSSKLQSKRSANLSQQSETEIVGDIISRKGMEMALQESEEAFRTLAETVPQIVWATRADGSNIFFNQQWVEYTGLTLEESYGHGWNIPFHPDDKQRAWDAWQNATKHGATYSLEVRLQRADGIYRWWLVRGAPLLDTTGKIINWFGTCTDIDDLKQAERRQTLSTKILGILNNPASMDDAISKIITTLKRETGFDAIGIRLQRGDDFPYIAQDGFSKEFILAENTLAVRAEDGGVCVDKDGNVCLECTCGMVISGKTDPTNPIFTPNGSCWTNESCARADHPIADERLHPRDRCIHEGYHSVALIPLRADKRIVGILQLNDHRPNQFTLEMISFLEDMGALIGIAVARKRAEDELEAANRELEERVTARTADLNRTNEQLRQEVGERRRVEDRLRQSEMRMERAQEIAHLGSWELDLVSNHLSWSDEVYRIFGLQPQEFGATYEAFLDRVHPDDRAAVDSAYSGSLREGRDSYEIEHRVLRKSDGEIRIVHEKCEHFRNESGTIIRSIGMVHDITERKLAEESLRSGEEQFRTLADSIPNLAWWANGDGYITWYNRRWYEYTGTTPEQMEGWGWQSVHDPKALPQVLERWKASIATGEPFDMELPLLGADGIFRSFLTRVLPLKDSTGRVIRWFGTNTDISALKRIEDELRKSEELYRSLFDNMLNGFAYCRMIFDEGRPQDFIYLSINDTFTTLTGLKDVVGKKVTEVIPGIREADPKLFELYSRVALSGRPERTEIYDEALKAWYSISVYSPEKEFFVTVFDVITERKRAEEEIKKLNEDLFARNEQLEFSNKELESFIYSVSHDLRAPLRHISGFSDLLKKNIADKLDEKGQRYFSLIQDASEKMSRLIDDLLNLSRISRQEISRTEVDMSVIVGSIIKDLREAQPNRSVEVDIREGLTALADSGLIEVALSNLLGNSWKFTAKTEHARIEFGSVEQDGKIFYCVRDNGVGFDQQYAGKMFWPFHRLHSEAAFEGTGIGLAIVDRIIRCHGGKIWAEGIEGKGAKICFSLA